MDWTVKNLSYPNSSCRSEPSHIIGCCHSFPISVFVSGLWPLYAYFFPNFI